ncbi:hypothetical protein BCR44DRAFT_340969 [Catenaria anguillulae PL171]|uniref:Uncharacterized protein n=1 Tax=Catenaria anguillulae PL171 TaxID=765915 RepID=A0A1Y2HBP1_9FUNG|nr:hypothetical protein BCR44DRAFT_340969 [Catenaria anguillulae PL171]
MTEQGVTQPARRPCQERGDSLELALNGQDLRFVAGDAKLCFCCGSLDHLRNHIPSSTQQPFKGSSSSGSAPTSPSLLHTIRTCNENTILCAHTRKLVAIVKLVARAGILQLFDYIEKFVNGVFDLLHLGGVHETRYLGQLNGTDEHVAVSRLFGSASASLGVSMTSVGIACASAKLHALLAHVPAYDLEEESGALLVVHVKKSSS